MKKILTAVLILLTITATSFANDLAPSPKLQEFNTDGTVCAGCYLYTYDTATTTPRATKVSQSGSSNTNPIVLDSAGRASVWLDGSEYRFVLKEDDDSTTIYTVDNIATFPASGSFTFGSITATGVDFQDLDGLINIGNEYMIDSTEADQGANSSGYPTTLKTVKDYVDNIGASKKSILVFTHSTASTTTDYTFSTDETISSNFELKFRRGAQFSIDSAKTVTVNGNIDAGPFQIKTGSGTLSFGSTAKISEAYPQWTGALGDNTNDDTAEIQEILTAINAGGGGVVHFPAGTYLVSETGSTGYCLNVLSNTNVIGSNDGGVVITIADSTDANLINMVSASNVKIANMTIDGNRANQTTTSSGIYVESATNLYIDNVTIYDTEVDGIIFEDGTIAQAYLTNLYLYNIGASGIQLNNKDDDNTGLFLNNIRIDSHGLDAGLTGEGGIEIRGPAKLSNIHIAGMGADDIGIVFRDGALLAANGYGGHRSSLTNFDVRSGSTSTTYGVYVVAEDVQISNGYVNGAEIGFYIVEDRARVSNVVAEDCTTGIYFDEAGSFIANGGVLVGSTSLNATTYGLRLDAENLRISECFVTGAGTHGVKIDANSTDTRIVNNYLDGNTAAVTDAGTTTHFSRNIGYVTENSGTGSITSGGTSDVITHGLDVTPTIDQITITASEDPTNTPGVIFVNTIGASEFTVNVENDPGASNLDFGWHVAVY